MNNLKNLLFMFFLIWGLMISFSSNNLMTLWFGIEMCFISFIPLMSSENFSSDGVMKYFIVQSMSSMFLIMGVVLLMVLNISIGDLIMSIALIMKMGCSPFHNWVLSIVDFLSYNSVFFLLTFLKLPLLVFLSYTSCQLWFFIILTLMVGSVMGLNQFSLKSIMTYSSIFNLGFVIYCINYNTLWIFYMLMYSFICYCCIYMLKAMNLIYLNQVLLSDYKFLLKSLFWCFFLSLGGMPPTLGFLMKLMVIEFVLYNCSYVLSFLMIFSSILVMFYYMRISFMSIIGFSSLLSINIMELDMKMIFLFLLNILMLPLFCLLKGLT